MMAHRKKIMQDVCVGGAGKGGQYLIGTKIYPTFNWTVLPSSASTQRNGTESSKLKVQKSVAVLINVLGLHKNILIALVVIVMCYV